MTVNNILGTLTVYFCRLNLSIALVSMVKQNMADKKSNNSMCPKILPTEEKPINITAYDDADFDWLPGAQGNRHK